MKALSLSSCRSVFLLPGSFLVAESSQPQLTEMPGRILGQSPLFHLFLHFHRQKQVFTTLIEKRMTEKGLLCSVSSSPLCNWLWNDRDFQVCPTAHTPFLSLSIYCEMEYLILTWKGVCFNHGLKAVYRAISHGGLLHIHSADPTYTIALKLQTENANQLGVCPCKDIQ